MRHERSGRKSGSSKRIGRGVRGAGGNREGVDRLRRARELKVTGGESRMSERRRGRAAKSGNVNHF